MIPRDELKKPLLFAGALLAATCAYFLLPADMDEPPRRMAALFVLALVLWVTEAIPLFATSLLLIMAESWLLVTSAPAAGASEYTVVLNAFSSPVVWIFLGGFILAKSIQQEGLDVQMAGLLMRPFGTRPTMILAGFMVITAVFSMFMSNTATTAMMLVLLQPILHQLPEKAPFRKGLVLAIPFAANIGGIGTPIGTPPNAIALGQLEKMRGISISFAEWMLIAVPLLIVTLFFMWLALTMLYRPGKINVKLTPPRDFTLTWKAFVVYATFGVTVSLWLTGALHGIPTAVIAVLPAAVLTLTGVISRSDFNALDWDILMLIAGGIALGTGLTETGLDKWIIQLLPDTPLPLFALAAIFCFAGIALSTVMSNSVAANLLIPIALTAAAALPHHEAMTLAILTAITTSFAMALPISTPPNAIAYGTNEFTNRDLMLVGGSCSLLSGIIITLTGPMIVLFILGLLR